MLLPQNRYSEAEIILPFSMVSRRMHMGYLSKLFQQKHSTIPSSGLRIAQTLREILNILNGLDVSGINAVSLVLNYKAHVLVLLYY